MYYSIFKSYDEVMSHDTSDINACAEVELEGEANVKETSGYSSPRTIDGPLILNSRFQ